MDDEDRAQLLNKLVSSVFIKENNTNTGSKRNRDDTGGEDEKLKEIKIDSFYDIQ